jgi:hypothetical protein
MLKKKQRAKTAPTISQKGNDVISIAKKVNIASNAENYTAYSDKQW